MAWTSGFVVVSNVTCPFDAAAAAVAPWGTAVSPRGLGMEPCRRGLFGLSGSFLPARRDGGADGFVRGASVLPLVVNGRSKTMSK